MRKWLPLVAICFGAFMLVLDITIVSIALPDIATELHPSFSALQWVVDAYVLALAALLLGVGSLADLVGHRRAYVASLLLFGLSSLACGLAQNTAMLVGARAVEGIGAAGLSATTVALLNSTYQGRDRGKAFGIWGAVSGAAGGIGPLLGGVIVQASSWRWIFFVNLPVCAGAIVLSLRFLRADPGERGRHVDVAGTALFTAFAGVLTYALIDAAAHGWDRTEVWILLAVAAVALALFLAVESRLDDPMLDVSLFRGRSFVGTMIAALFLNLGAFAALLYASIWLQTVLGLSAVEAGLVLAPMSVTGIFASVTTGRFLHGFPPGRVIGVGMLLIGAGALLEVALLRGGASWPALLPGLVVTGLGMGMAIPTFTSAIMAAVRPQRGGMASGAVNTVRQLGYALGIAAVGSMFASFAARSLASAGLAAPDRIADTLSAGQAGRLLAGAPSSAKQLLDTALHHAALSGLDGAFALAAAGAVGAGVAVLVLVRGHMSPPDAEPALAAAAPADPAG